MIPQHLLGNRPLILRDAPYASIIGSSPSKGARSPILWNSVYSYMSSDTIMYPFDVSPDNLFTVLEALQRDQLYIGGAIAVPYKELVAKWLGPERIVKASASIGSVNCIYRGDGGLLYGTNTDGEAAVRCLQSIKSNLKDLNILQIGCGGAGKAVASFIAEAGGKMTIMVRNQDKVISFATPIGANIISFDAFEDYAINCDVIVNTTDIGYKGTEKNGMSPLSNSQISMLSDKCFVYDIVYDPDPTHLLEMSAVRGLRTLNGRCMNLEQAVLAFDYCNKSTGVNVAQVMKNELIRQGW